MDRAKRELLCQNCSCEYPVWYCAHYFWTPVAAQLEKDTGVPVHFLCLNCFAEYAAQMVTEDNPDCRVIWKLEIGGREDASILLASETGAEPDLCRVEAAQVLPVLAPSRG